MTEITGVWHDEAQYLRPYELQTALENEYERYHSNGRRNRIRLLMAGTSLCANPRFRRGYNV